MGDSIAANYVHLVFSTKKRERLIYDIHRERFHRYVNWCVNQRMGCRLLAVNSVEDHVHVFFQLKSVVPLANVVEEVKTNTSRWFKTLGPGTQHFSWQVGYAAFSVSPRDCEMVKAYIAKQREHHRNRDAVDELRELFRESGWAWEARFGIA